MHTSRGLEHPTIFLHNTNTLLKKCCGNSCGTRRHLKTILKLSCTRLHLNLWQKLAKKDDKEGTMQKKDDLEEQGPNLKVEDMSGHE